MYVCPSRRRVAPRSGRSAPGCPPGGAAVMRAESIWAFLAGGHLRAVTSRERRYRAGRITRQHLQPRRLSRSPAPGRVIRPGSGADPPAEPTAFRAGSATTAPPAEPAPRRATPTELPSSPKPGASTTHPARRKLRPGTSDTAPGRISARAPLNAPQGFTVGRRLRLPPEVSPDHAHRVPDTALTCPSARRAKCDLISAFARTQKGSSDDIRKRPLTWEPPYGIEP
jgi:hypothetical protein